MLRTILAVIAYLSLAGCWVSETQLFGSGDWAHLGLDGDYRSENANGDTKASVHLSTRPNGLIEGTSTDLTTGAIEKSLIGLVAIEGGSGRYYLMVDRSDEGDERDDGALYLVARLTDENALEFFWPDCAGTSPVAGMESSKDGTTEVEICAFSSKAALMQAGLEAERFLSVPHIVEIAPMGKLVPDDGSDDEPE